MQTATDWVDPTVLKRDEWRLDPASFGEVKSRGAWVRYPWIAYVLRRVHRSVMRGGARIVVNAPPRHGKSMGTSLWLPAWYLGLHPDHRVILASHGDRFATKWGRAVRQRFEDDPDVLTIVSQDRSAANDWYTTEGGGMLSVGVGGSVTGEGAQLTIIDDPVKSWEEALSPTKRERLVDWFNATLYTRSEPGGSIVVNMTRWHEADLSGYLLDEHEDDWEHIRLPALAEENDPLGREPGEALCPERFPVDALQQIRSAMSEYLFAGLYQQRPAPLEGGIVKRDWFRRWTDLPDRWDDSCQSWDLTFKAGGSSYVVGQVWLRSGSDFYLVDQVRDRLDFPQTIAAIQRLSAAHPGVATKIVEEAANGHAVLATLRDKIPGLVGVRPDGSKEARLFAVSGLVEAGNVYIPARAVAPWSEDFIEEAVNFPHGANDDQVDAMTMALARLSRRGAPTFNLAIPTAGARPSPWSF